MLSTPLTKQQHRQCRVFLTGRHFTLGVFVAYAGKPKPTWQVQQAKHVVQQLNGKPGSMRTIGHALAAVAQDVQPGDVSCAGDAAYVRAAAEGVLFEGLASLLRQVSLLFTHILQLYLIEVSQPCGSNHECSPSCGQTVQPRGVQNAGSTDGVSAVGSGPLNAD